MAQVARFPEGCGLTDSIQINIKCPIAVSGLGLPDRSYYLEDNERFANIRAEYVLLIQQILDFAKVENSAEKAQQILALETPNS